METPEREEGEVEDKVEVESRTEPKPEPELDDEGRPGGDDPQAVRARKEYQRRVKAQKELEQERITRLQLEERLRTLEEVSKQSKAKVEEPVYTLAQVNAAVDKGAITRAEADVYIDTVLFPKKIEAALSERDKREKAQKPMERARADIDQYMTLIPDLADRTSDSFRKVSAKVRELTEFGYPDGPVTDRMAAELVFGSIDTLKRKQELSRQAPPRTLPSDNGGGTPSPSGKLDISKAPETMRQLWDRDNLDQKTRERRYKIYLDLKAQKEARR